MSKYKCTESLINKYKVNEIYEFYCDTSNLELEHMKIFLSDFPIQHNRIAKFILL